MRYLLITLILLFYIFFFIRAYTLTKSLGKSIKAKNRLLNLSIFSAGISTILFLWYLIFPQSSDFLFIILKSDTLEIIGLILIVTGLITSSVASLSLKKSWRIGVDNRNKTDLITGGIYRISRNPYFLSYDIFLTGMVFCLFSLVLIVPVIITMTLFHILILKEEKYLERQHQDYYRIYKKEVKRYI